MSQELIPNREAGSEQLESAAGLRLSLAQEMVDSVGTRMLEKEPTTEADASAVTAAALLLQDASELYQAAEIVRAQGGAK